MTTTTKTTMKTTMKTMMKTMMKMEMTTTGRVEIKRMGVIRVGIIRVVGTTMSAGTSHLKCSQWPPFPFLPSPLPL